MKKIFFKSNFEDFRKKFELSLQEQESLLEYEQRMKKSKEKLNEVNEIITIEDMAGVNYGIDKECQCNEKELDEELRTLKMLRDMEKQKLQSIYKGFKQDQKVTEKKIDNGKKIEISFSGNKSILNDNLKECRFKDARHIIYPLTEFKFSLFKTKKMSFEFEVKTYTIWIAVGLCDLRQINKNCRIFYKPRNNEYPHGTFVLGSVRKFEEGYKVIKFHHSGNLCGAYDVQNDFPYFLPGRKIKVLYDSETRKLTYSCGVCEVIIENVTSVNGEDDILAPCIVFFYDEDKIQLSDFIIENK